MGRNRKRGCTMKKLKKNYTRNKNTLRSMNTYACVCGPCPCGWEDYRYQYSTELKVEPSNRVVIVKV